MFPKFSFLSIAIFILSVSSALAYHPTPESLFRNASNPTIKQDTLVANFAITPVGRVAAQGLQGYQGAEELGVFPEGQEQTIGLKLLYSLSEGRGTRVLQLLYNGRRLNNANLTEMKSLNAYPSLVKRASNEFSDRGAFYALLNSLLLNDGTLMLEFLNGQGVSLPFNRQLVRSEKSSLLKEIHSYFKKIKYSPVLKDKITSPFRPSSREERLRVQEILNSNFFTLHPSVERVARGSEFFWRIKKPRFQSFHTNEGRKLVSWSLETKGGKIEYFGQDFMLFDGVHEFPKTIYFKDLANQFYRIRMLSMNFFTDSPTRYQKRFQEYRKAAAKNQHLVKTLNRPSIIF